MSRALCWGLVAIFGVSVAGAQEEEKATVLTLRPAGEPVPALRYRLVPQERSLVPGNAALLYYRAMQMVVQERDQRMTNQAGQDAPKEENPEMRIADWVSGPLEKVPVEEARTQLEAFRKVLHEVELGAQRRDCDWEFDLREEGVELVMPQIQEMRALAAAGGAAGSPGGAGGEDRGGGALASGGVLACETCGRVEDVDPDAGGNRHRGADEPDG